MIVGRPLLRLVEADSVRSAPSEPVPEQASARLATPQTTDLAIFIINFELLDSQRRNTSGLRLPMPLLHRGTSRGYGGAQDLSRNTIRTITLEGGVSSSPCRAR